MENAIKGISEELQMDRSHRIFREISSRITKEIWEDLHSEVSRSSSFKKTVILHDVRFLNNAN